MKCARAHCVCVARKQTEAQAPPAKPYAYFRIHSVSRSHTSCIFKINTTNTCFKIRLDYYLVLLCCALSFASTYIAYGMDSIDIIIYQVFFFFNFSFFAFRSTFNLLFSLFGPTKMPSVAWRSGPEFQFAGGGGGVGGGVGVCSKIILSHFAWSCVKQKRTHVPTQRRWKPDNKCWWKHPQH